jgi:hypothetical protein
MEILAGFSRDAGMQKREKEAELSPLVAQRRKQTINAERFSEAFLIKG